MTKKIRLTQAEQALEYSFGKDKWKSAPPEKKTQMIQAARATLKRQNKDMRTNIRLSQLDVDLIRHQAEQEGLPYQTLISSIIHKYVTNQLVERKVVEELKDAIRREKKAV